MTKDTVSWVLRRRIPAPSSSSISTFRSESSAFSFSCLRFLTDWTVEGPLLWLHAKSTSGRQFVETRVLPSANSDSVLSPLPSASWHSLSHFTSSLPLPCVSPSLFYCLPLYCGGRGHNLYFYSFSFWKPGLHVPAHHRLPPLPQVAQSQWINTALLGPLTAYWSQINLLHRHTLTDNTDVGKDTDDHALRRWNAHHACTSNTWPEWS